MLEHKLPTNKWTLETAAHLLNRAAFGGSPLDIQQFFNMGHEGAVNCLLKPLETDFLEDIDVKKAILIPLGEALLEKNKLSSTLSLNEHTVFYNRTTITKDVKEKRKEVKKALLKLFKKSIKKIQHLWITSMMTNTFSAKDKIALFWHSNITIQADGNSSNCITVKRYLDLLRKHGLAEFPILIKAVSKEYEMAQFLNLKNNKVNKINENFARELLELFMLGEGNYTENDVKETARVFTGFSFNNNFNLVINSRFADKKSKTIFNHTDTFTPDTVIDLIAEKQECSEYIASKIWKFYVSEHLDKSLTTELGKLFRKVGMNVSEFLKIIFLSEAFFSKSTPQIKSPVQLIVQAYKQLELQPSSSKVLSKAINLLTEMGQDLFFPPNVRGWVGGQEWITTSTLLTRYSTMDLIAKEISSETIEAILPSQAFPEVACNLISALLFQAPPSVKFKQNFVDFIQKTDYGSLSSKKELLKLSMSTPQYQLI